MSFVALCPGCSSRLSIPDKLRGGSITCPKCRRLFAVPQVRAPQVKQRTEEPKITFACDCGTTLRLPADQDGVFVTCPKCGRPAYTPAAKAKLDVMEDESIEAKLVVEPPPVPREDDGARPKPKMPLPVPRRDDEVEELRREVRQLRRQVEPRPKKKKTSPAAAFVISFAVLFVVFMLCLRDFRDGGKGDTGFYGMTAKECVARWGEPGRIEGGETVGAFVYPAAGMKIVISRGRVLRFDNLQGERMNSHEADKRLRGVR